MQPAFTQHKKQDRDVTVTLSCNTAAQQYTLLRRKQWALLTKDLVRYFQGISRNFQDFQGILFYPGVITINVSLPDTGAYHKEKYPPPKMYHFQFRE